MNLPSIPKSFFNGDCFDAYRILGAHPWQGDHGEEGWRFAVWAPGATAVEVCGGFDGWGAGIPLQKADTGVWSGFVSGLCEGELYKYRIHGADGSVVMRADPYAFASEVRPANASRLTKLDFSFDDSAWMERRDKCRNLPMNIYELHAGSWKHKPDSTQPDGSDGWYDYEELARELIPWLLEHHFTHVELLPLAEHPFDGSWGYQTTGYFAVTSRYGTPAQFASFVNACHRMGIGVIMDFVPVHFAANADALANFDGTHLYEYDSDVGHSEWGTCNFNYYRREVCSFLNSAAALWMEVYHCDGIRMDAISRALYWQGDPARGVNEGAVTFLRNLNHGLNDRWPTGVYMAEDSTNFLKVTAPTRYDGIGFDYKWDMGWMHDTLDYFATPFGQRPDAYGKIIFSMHYFYNELYLLALSHDEVVHGKCSLIGRMPGDWWRQFAGLRTLAFYQMTHPGAKLNFMGNEIGQFIEWRYYESIQWFLTEEYETHRHHQAFIKALNHLYTAEPALYERGYTDDGFTWIDADNSKQSIVSFVRQGEDVDDDLVILINFDPASYESFRVGVPREGDWEVIFDSDRPEFGGSGYAGEEPYTCSSEPYPWNGQMDSIEIKVPGLAGVVLKRRGPSSYKPPVVEEPKAAPKKRTSSVKPKPAAAKKAPAKAKATTTKAKAKATAKPAAKAAAKKPAAKKAATKAKSASAKPSAKDA